MRPPRRPDWPGWRRGSLRGRPAGAPRGFRGPASTGQEGVLLWALCLPGPLRQHAFSPLVVGPGMVHQLAAPASTGKTYYIQCPACEARTELVVLDAIRIEQ